MKNLIAIQTLNLLIADKQKYIEQRQKDINRTKKLIQNAEHQIEGLQEAILRLENDNEPPTSPIN